MGRRIIRFGSIVGATALTAGGLLVVAGPASAEDFSVTSFDEFVVALDAANSNGTPDRILIDTQEIDWTYPGTLTVAEDLEVITVGQNLPKLHSTDAAAMTVTAGVRFSAYRLALTGDGDPGNGIPGVGLDASAGADLRLAYVDLLGSADAGLRQVGGTLYAEYSIARDNGGWGFDVSGVSAVELVVVNSDTNGSGLRLAMQDGSASLTNVVTDRNAALGMSLEVVGGTLTVLRTMATQNGLAADDGGGIRLEASDGAAVSFQSTGARANAGPRGAGLWVRELSGPSTSVSITMGTFGSNTAVGSGGGIAVGATDGEYGITDGARLIIDRANVSNNRAGASGGGIHLSGVAPDARVTVIGSSIRGNTSADGVGGLAVGPTGGSGNPVHIEGSVIALNVGTSVGGLRIECADEPATPVIRVVNSTLSGNLADEVAGAAAVDCGHPEARATLELLHATVSDNGGDAEAAILISAADAVVRNTIIGGNAHPADLVSDGQLVVDYSLIQRPGAGSVPAVGAGVGNITGEAPDIAPLGPFADRPTWIHLPLEQGNVVNAGDPAFSSPPELDQKGDPRVDGRLDIGAVELAGVGLPPVASDPEVLPATGSAASGWGAAAAILLLVAGLALALVRRRPV